MDLLEPSTEARYALKPERLLEDWASEKKEWIVIDEIQKNTALLNVVQKGIVKSKIKFALTGSSARKLKRGSANLLGGRAVEFHLHPFTDAELKGGVPLLELLRWGALPEIISLEPDSKVRMLYSYVSTYLKEEVLAEQIIRKIEPFRRFLEVAAQMNGKILNFAKIARDAGVEERSVQRYYQILEDTLLGFFLPPFQYSLRKRQAQKSKFYFFDTGVTRALQNTLPLELVPQTHAFGDLFEQFFILECIRLNDYYETRFQFSYLRTKEDVEVDLIVEKPNKEYVLIEIKSADKVQSEQVKSLKRISADFKARARSLIVSNQKQGSVIEGIHCLHWQAALDFIFK